MLEYITDQSSSPLRLAGAIDVVMNEAKEGTATRNNDNNNDNNEDSVSISETMGQLCKNNL